MTATIADAKETGFDAAVASVLSKLDCIFTLKEQQRVQLKAFLCEQHIYAFLATGLGKTLFKQCGVSQLGTGR